MAERSGRTEHADPHSRRRDDLLLIDGARFSGSGSVVRQSMAYAALTGIPISVVNVRARRPKPGLRRQHLAAVQAISALVGGRLEGAHVSSRVFAFHPGAGRPEGTFSWDIGTAGSATALALALIPVLAGRGGGCDVELRGGVFQDFVPSLFHLRSVVLPLLARMGLPAELELVRPGYVPRGSGILRLRVPEPPTPLRPLVLGERGRLTGVSGVAIASHLAERKVAARMAESAREALGVEGVDASIEQIEDTTAAQPGAALALFAAYGNGVHLGADRAGAPGRRSEDIGRHVALQLLEEMRSPATVDRFAADQLIPFAALADGTSSFRASRTGDHVDTGAWLASTFLGVQVDVDRRGRMSVAGRGMPQPAGSPAPEP